MSTAEGRRPLREVVTPRRIVISILLAAAVVGIGWGFSRTAELDPNAGLPAPVIAVSPKPGAPNAAPQSAVFYELIPGYEHVAMTIEGTQIPDDQLTRFPVNGLHVEFRPGSGKVLTTLPKGRVRVEITFARVSDLTPLRYSWVFNVG